MRVIAMGKVSVYPRDGVYQLTCASMVMDGIGDLYAAFEQLKDKLAKGQMIAAGESYGGTGVTVIPDFYDLIRSNTLVPAVPGKTALAVDEYYKRIMAFDVSEKGFLRNVRTFLEHGEYSVINDLENDRVYVADGDLLVCNASGEILKRITMEDRPGTLALSPEGDVLFVTARSNVYAVKVK